MTKAGGKTWFFITADYAFGLALERDTTAAVEKAGGKVLGHVRHPLSSSDFSSFLLQARPRRGGDRLRQCRQRRDQFDQAGGRIRPHPIGAEDRLFLMFLPDVKALGTQAGQGFSLTETFYWDLNDATRAFTARFSKRMKSGAVPSMPQAGVYGVTLHYLKAAAALDGDVKDGARVVAKMKEIPTDNPLFGQGKIRMTGVNTSRLSVSGQDPSGMEGPLGPLQPRRHHSG